MGKMHCFFTEGTHAPLASGLSYKVTSSLRHSIVSVVMIKNGGNDFFFFFKKSVFNLICRLYYLITVFMKVCE